MELILDKHFKTIILKKEKYKRVYKTYLHNILEH